MIAERVTVPIATVFAMITLLPTSYGQELSQYRTHEPIHIELADKNQRQKEAEVRRLLWENWSNRKPCSHCPDRLQ